MNLLVWNTLFGDVVRHLLDGNLVSMCRPERALVRVKLLLHSFSKGLLENRSKWAFRKHLRTLRGHTLSMSVLAPKISNLAASDPDAKQD